MTDKPGDGKQADAVEGLRERVARTACPTAWTIADGHEYTPGAVDIMKAHAFAVADRVIAAIAPLPVLAYAAENPEIMRELAEGARDAEFQARVKPWMDACFGPEISSDVVERNHRFIEEALELVQAKGYTRGEAHQLVDYVFDRPAGEPNQEVGGVMVTLAALCLAAGLDMHKAAETELARVWQKIDKIRAKQAAKPKHSPLPILAAVSPSRSRRRAGDQSDVRERRGGVSLTTPNQLLALADIERLGELQSAAYKSAQYYWGEDDWASYCKAMDAVLPALLATAKEVSELRETLTQTRSFHADAEAWGRDLEARLVAETARAEASEHEAVGLRDALTRIAAFDDMLASDRLGSNGSYSGFDEPGSVQIAREAIAQQSRPTEQEDRHDGG